MTHPKPIFTSRPDLTAYARRMQAQNQLAATPLATPELKVLWMALNNAQASNNQSKVLALSTRIGVTCRKLATDASSRGDHTDASEYLKGAIEAFSNGGFGCNSLSKICHEELAAATRQAFFSKMSE